MLLESIENWVHAFESTGFGGLREDPRSGRPARLNHEQLTRIGQVLRQEPRAVGIEAGLWDGKTLSRWLSDQMGVRFWASVGLSTSSGT
jgi:transposase